MPARASWLGQNRLALVSILLEVGKPATRKPPAAGATGRPQERLT